MSFGGSDKFIQSVVGMASALPDEEPEKLCRDSTTSKKVVSNLGEEFEPGDSSSMLRESRLGKRRENREQAVSTDDEVIQNVWQKYRPTAAINFSDLVEERTMDGVFTSSSFSSPTVAKQTFEPTEITGRSTGRVMANNRKTKNDYASIAAKMTTNMILDSSLLSEIRSLKECLHENSGVEVGSRNSLPFNKVSADSIAIDGAKEVAWNRTCNAPPKVSGLSVASDEFSPFDQMQAQLDVDEREWEKEYGILPPESDSREKLTASVAESSKVDSKMAGKLVNLTEFSGYLADSNAAEKNLSDFSNMSLGKFFGKRCQDINEMIPVRSPPKRRPVALLGDSYRTGSDFSHISGDSKKYSQGSSSFYTDDELKIKSLPRITNATYDKKSIMSVSSIAAKLGDDSQESPATFVTNYLRAKAAAASSITSASAIGKSANTQSSTAAFATANNSLGMLAQMNSTRIDSDKENKNSRNSSADTEVLSEFGNFVDNLSPAASGYESSFKEKSPRRNLVPLTSTQCNEEPQPASNMKRMRSPQPSISGTTSQIRSPDEFTKQKSPSPNIFPAQKNGTHQRAEEKYEREFVAVPHRSPMDGSKFSLPSYGLRNGARGLSQSPTACPVRSSSQLSTNSEFSQNDGKFPLKANQGHLVWSCVKLQKSVTKSFVVKNTAHKRLTVKLNVTGPGFQITPGQGPLVLQGNECRTISVAFSPTVIGKAIGKVSFKPLKGWPDETERLIHLYGYGGHTTLQLQGTERGPIGGAYLKMGETSSIRSTTLQRTFFIYNKGPLNGMATISVKPKTNQYIHETHIQIEPSKCVIKADSSVKVMVSYKLRRKDIEKLSQKSCEVLTVATLEVIIGADCNRQRIATILTRTPIIPSTYRSLDFLIKDFPRLGAEDFSDFGENEDNIAELFNCFKTADLALTINRTTLDETRDTCTDLSGIEESFFFRTLVDERADVQPQTNRRLEMGSEQSHAASGTWSVHPLRLTMDHQENHRKQLTIRNGFNQSQTFQLESNYRQLLTFTPESGLVNANDTCTVDVRLRTNIYIPADLKITVFIESDSIEVPIAIRSTPPYMNFK